MSSAYVEALAPNPDFHIINDVHNTNTKYVILNKRIYVHEYEYEVHVYYMHVYPYFHAYNTRFILRLFNGHTYTLNCTITSISYIYKI